MNIAVIGAGYVGLTAAPVFSNLKHKVWLVENDSKKLKILQQHKIPFYEPGLTELFKKEIAKRSLIPTLDYAQAIPGADAIFICVGTPSLPNGKADISYVLSAVKEIAKHLKKYVVVVLKSSVPVGTTDYVGKIIAQEIKASFDIAFCPEFLREGFALFDTFHPDRIVLGTQANKAKKILLEIHKKLPGERVITDTRTAEIIKYASNAFLATRISFINEISNLCEKVDADVDNVASGMGFDPRIGKAFLKAGIGYGGACLPKDTKALLAIGSSHKCPFKLIKAVIEVNRKQRNYFLEKVKKNLGSLKGKRIGVLGLAFKNNTDDVRESAAIEIIRELMKKGAKITAFDPKAGKNAKTVLPDLKIAEKPEEVARGADGILILTEWSVFQKINWPYMKKKMRSPIIIDGRNLLDPKRMRALGFIYHSMGRP